MSVSVLIRTFCACVCFWSHRDCCGHRQQRRGEGRCHVTGFSHRTEPEGEPEDLLWRPAHHRKLQVLAHSKLNIYIFVFFINWICIFFVFLMFYWCTLVAKIIWKTQCFTLFMKRASLSTTVIRWSEPCWLSTAYLCVCYKTFFLSYLASPSVQAGSHLTLITPVHPQMLTAKPKSPECACVPWFKEDNVDFCVCFLYFTGILGSMGTTEIAWKSLMI